MSTRRNVLAWGCAIGLCATAADAFAQSNNAQCRAELVLRKQDDALKSTTDATNFCNLLAGVIYTELSTGPMDKVLTSGALSVADVFSQRDLQNRSTQQAASGGTPAQGHAIPSIQPAGVAAGTIAALGTRSGQDAIAALSLNPAVLFLAETATNQLARVSRVADVTVFLPVSAPKQPGAGDTSADANKLRYFGARVRFNFIGASNGDDVWQNAEKLLKEQIVQAAIFQGRLATVLARVPDLKKCLAGLAPGAAPVAPGAAPPCETLDTGWTLDAGVAARLGEELARIRRRADAKYFGADLRFDFGDPTLGDVENASGTFMFAGLAAGRRFDDGKSATTSGLRGRLGIRHAKLDSEPDAEFAAEGGVGFEIARHMAEGDEVNVSAGIEFRRGGAPPNATDQFQTDFTMLRGSILLPITRGNSLSINVGRPIAGDVSSIFSVNFNWGLLLSDRPGR